MMRKDRCHRRHLACVLTTGRTSRACDDDLIRVAVGHHRKAAAGHKKAAGVVMMMNHAAGFGTFRGCRCRPTAMIGRPAVG